MLFKGRKASLGRIKTSMLVIVSPWRTRQRMKRGNKREEDPLYKPSAFELVQG